MSLIIHGNMIYKVQFQVASTASRGGILVRMDLMRRMHVTRHLPGGCKRKLQTCMLGNFRKTVHAGAGGGGVMRRGASSQSCPRSSCRGTAAPRLPATPTSHVRACACRAHRCIITARLHAALWLHECMPHSCCGTTSASFMTAPALHVCLGAVCAMATLGSRGRLMSLPGLPESDCTSLLLA